MCSVCSINIELLTFKIRNESEVLTKARARRYAASAEEDDKLVGLFNGPNRRAMRRAYILQLGGIPEEPK